MIPLVTTLVAAALATREQGADGHHQMNRGVKYLIANSPPGHEDMPRSFSPKSEYFEVLSPPIRSRYAGVVWRVLEAVPLPPDVVRRYNDSVMAVTGYEVDVLRKDATGNLASVPNYQSYNHHYTSALHGAGAALAPHVVGASNLHHRELFFLPTAVKGPAGVPAVQAFNEHNGNEARQSYHGLPSGFVQPLFAPQAFIFNPMQINTLNPDGTGKRGGPLPRASAAAPGANYSGLLECPCTTRIVKDLKAKTIDGSVFDPQCATDPRRSNLRATGNPTCDISTYVGGMECCKDGMVLLDADQPQPEAIDEVFYRWRFYHEPFDARRHTPLVHLEWAVNGCDSAGMKGNPNDCHHIEYDAVQAPEGTPPEKAVHTAVSHFQFRDMLAPDCSVEHDHYCASLKTAEARGGMMRLLMAGGHCHSPACIALELWNADTGELVCRVTPRHGQGDDVYDEAGYLWLPPCMWGAASDSLLPPPAFTLDANLTAIKHVNVTSYHYGVMGIWQMRGAYGDM